MFKDNLYTNSMVVDVAERGFDFRSAKKQFLFIIYQLFVETLLRNNYE